MFEDMTYESILKRVLDAVSSNVDKRQGSVIYDAVAPACAELAQLYIALENTVNSAFADTAPREYLVLRARERGIEPYPATYSLCRGVFNMDIPIGTKFSIDKINFIAERKTGNYEYEMRCETAGEEGNRHLGKLIAVDYIDGLETAALTEVLVPGEEEEDTEDFRTRYFDSIRNTGFNGNKADYISWAKTVEGVGQAKVERAYKGGGNVRLILADKNNEPASAELLGKVKEKLDPRAYEGLGEGVAPIGHRVLVEAAVKYPVNVSVTLKLKSGYSISGIKPSVMKKIEEYLKEVNNSWEQGDIVIYSAQILVRLIDISGIDNITSVRINNGDYVKISGSSIASMGTLEVA